MSDEPSGGAAGRRYLSGGSNALMRRPAQRGDEIAGGWTREQLLQMDHRYVAAVEAAIRLGLEASASASTCERPGAGDRERLSLAS